MSERPVLGRDVKSNVIFDALAPGLLIYQYKDYTPLPPVPISGQASGVLTTPTTLATQTIPPQQTPFRVKRITADVIPPPSTTPATNQPYNLIQLIASYGSTNVLLYQRYVYGGSPFNDQVYASGEDSIAILPPNATVTLQLVVTANATYTSFNAVVYLDTLPPIETVNG